jgi:uncharacterized protein
MRGGVVAVRAALAVSLGALAGCASQMTAQDRAGFEAYLAQGDYAGAAAAAKAAGQITPDGQTHNVVWSLNAGSTLFEAGDMKGSVAVLDTTERLAQGNDLHPFQAVMDYRYTTYDGVMTNLYKAMAFIAQNDPASARVEFNRAEDRQRRAEEHFKAAIEAAQRQPARQKPAFGDLMDKAQQNDAWRSSTASLSALANYPAFENPFATWMGGVFFVTQGDRPKGIQLLRRAAAELGPQSPAADDLAWAQGQGAGQGGSGRARRGRAAAAAAAAAQPQTWIVFENGQSATYHQIDLQLPMVTGAPMRLALPVLHPNAPAYPAVVARTGTAQATTGLAGSFDSVMASEFQRRQPEILAEAVAEIVAKNAVSVAASRSNNGFVKIASLVFAQVSTADTRSWLALPKEFQTARLPTPADGHVTLTTADGATLGDVQVPTDRPSVIWVKAQDAGAKPAIQVLKL